MMNFKPYTGPHPGVIERLFLNWVDKIVAGQKYYPEASSAMLDTLIEVDYYPGEEDEGTLDDFTTEERLNLVLGTNIHLRQSYRGWEGSQEQAILDLWPAQELYETYQAEEPVDWYALWISKGGWLFDGRMIALKNVPLWQSLSSFGLPYPPFAPGSAFDVRDVERDMAVELGLLDRRKRILPVSAPAPGKLFLF